MYKPKKSFSHIYLAAEVSNRAICALVTRRINAVVLHARQIFSQFGRASMVSKRGNTGIGMAKSDSLIPFWVVN